MQMISLTTNVNKSLKLEVWLLTISNLEFNRKGKRPRKKLNTRRGKLRLRSPSETMISLKRMTYMRVSAEYGVAQASSIMIRSKQLLNWTETVRIPLLRGHRSFWNRHGTKSGIPWTSVGSSNISILDPMKRRRTLSPSTMSISFRKCNRTTHKV